MKTNRKLLLSLMLTASFAVSCNEVETVTPTAKKPTSNPAQNFFQTSTPWEFDEGIYIAGGGYSTTNNIAKVWGAGLEQDLTMGAGDVNATSIFVSGNDIYVSGYSFGWYDHNRSYYRAAMAIIWRNGVGQALTNGTNEAEALSVFVFNNDVYVAGYESSSTKRVARLWKNGVVQPISSSTNETSGAAVYVSDNDVYVAGYELVGSTAVAKIWKNGIAQSLGDGMHDTYATSVFVSGSDVYVSGYGNSEGKGPAIVWKNGIAQQLESGSHAYINSIYVENGNVFAAGSEVAEIGTNQYGPKKAVAWKNGVQQFLSDGSQNAVAYSISGSGDDVYVVGFDGGLATIWKNGTAKHLSEGTASSVFIKK